ncbi:MAG: hypothetical protein AB1750_02740 [Chloroflexota bacterium]
MRQPVNALRVVIKAAILFALFNLLWAAFDPPVGKITGYNLLWPGRLRFPYEESPTYYLQGYNAPVLEDFDAMFGAHVISASPKQPDEFRVLLLGDSAVWGGHVRAQDALSEQLNRMDLTACDGRKVRVFNLGYPWPSTLRDLLILDTAMQYNPDLILWMVTLHSFEKKNEERQFLVPHAERMTALMQEHSLNLPAAYDDVSAPSFWDKTIVGQRKRLKDILLVQLFGPLWAATGIDNHAATPARHPPVSQEVNRDRSYFEYKSAQQTSVLLKSLFFETLRVGREIAAPAPVIVVNEPIFIVQGRNSDLRYNWLYPRWAYDAYRQSLADWTTQRGYAYLDYWNAVPATLFANEIFHRDPAGEAMYAELLAPSIVQSACP